MTTQLKKGDVISIEATVNAKGNTGYMISFKGDDKNTYIPFDCIDHVTLLTAQQQKEIDGLKVENKWLMEDNEYQRATVEQFKEDSYEVDKEITTLKQRIVELRGYARHDEDCKIHNFNNRGCTCGLSLILSKITF